VTPARARLVLRVVINLGAPLAAYYVLRWAGVGIYLSLLTSTLLSAAPGAVTFARERRMDGLSAYMTAMLVGSVVIALLSGSTRFLLAKEAILTGVTGIWFIASIAARRPLVFLFTRPLLEGRFRWPSTWDTLWDRYPRFRRMWRVSSLAWGIGLFADAVLRVVMAYTLPPDTVPALGTALYAATTVVLILGTNIYYFTCRVGNPYSKLYQPSTPAPVS
jgi:intracellular septation protein A